MAKQAAAKKGGKQASVVCELQTVTPKKSVVRFDSTDENPALASAYVSNDAIKLLGGAENGIRVTIEAL
jgi:hypothetical protein